MKKKFLLMSLAAATLLAGCSKDLIPATGGDDNGDSASEREITAKAFSNGDIGVGTRAPFTGTSLAGETADVYAFTEALDAHATPATMFTNAYGRGTMTFSDTKYVAFDKAGFNGNSLLPQDGSELYLYGFYPKGWELGKRKDDANTEALTHLLDGKTDLMSTYLTAGDDVKVAYKHATTPDKGDITFKHLLTRYHIQVKGGSAEAVTAWGSVKSINVKEAAKANNVVEIQQVDHVKYYNDNTKTAPSFYKLEGTLAAPTYKDDKYGGTNLATSQALTDAFVNACYTMIAPVTVDTDEATPELILEVVTLIADGKEKTTEVPVSLDDTKFAANAGSTRGYSVTVTLNFRAGSIQALSEVEEWKDGGTQNEDVDNTSPAAGPIDLSENGTANCYLVTKVNKGGYSFDATVRGNNNTGVLGLDYDGLPDLATATEARVIWQTDGTTAVIKTVKLSADKKSVVFNLGTATEGNAVIGLFASNAPTAPCLWSWHIWRVDGALPADVDCTKDPSPVSASKDFKMMALNLGAFNNVTDDPKAIGLIYQWGRKDPFPGPKDFTNNEPTNIYGSVSNGGTVVPLAGNYTVPNVQGDASNGTEAWAVQHPGVFITNGGDPYDWMVTKNDALWGTPWEDKDKVGDYNGNQGTKSIYDPCPVGYRVPPQDTWSLQTIDGTPSNNGVILEKVAAGFWFPAAGCRIGTIVGELADAGYGYFWSSSPFDATNINAGGLSFNGGGRVWPQGNDYRVSGVSVRCVAE